GEEIGFRGEVLSNGFDDDVCEADGGEVGGGLDPPDHGDPLRGAHLPFVHAALKVRGDGGHGALQQLVVDIDEGDVESRRGRGVRDAVAHGSGADDDDVL